MMEITRKTVSKSSAMEGSFVGDDPEAKPMTAGATRLPCCKSGVEQHLPRATSTHDGSTPLCPWCRLDMSDAVLTVGALNSAWQDWETDWPSRSDAGEAESGLTAQCPHCSKPSLIALGTQVEAEGGDRRYVRLVPVRTSADVAYLFGSAQ